MATWTKTADQCLDEARRLVERARQQLRAICGDRNLAALVAMRYDVLRERERTLARMEQAVAEGRPAEAVARWEIPF
jgi:hypothetical protein